MTIASIKSIIGIRNLANGFAFDERTKSYSDGNITYAFIVSDDGNSYMAQVYFNSDPDIKITYSIWENHNLTTEWLIKLFSEQTKKCLLRKWYLEKGFNIEGMEI